MVVVVCCFVVSRFMLIHSCVCLVSVMCFSCVCLVSVMCFSCVCHMFAMYLSCVSHVSVTCRVQSGMQPISMSCKV